jgi:hypothetical protein
MAEDIHGSAGARIFIGPTTSAGDVSAYEALSWTEITIVESIGDFGDTAGQGTFTGLGDNRVRKFKTAFDAGDVQIVIAHNALDAGQIAAKAAVASKFGYAFKVTLEDSADANDTDSAYYFHAKVMGMPIGIGGNGDVTKRTLNLSIDTEIFSDESVTVA